MNTHFQGIGIENFRVFKDSQYFDFAPITVLTGTNSSGKSSLINLLELLKETYSDYANRSPVRLWEVGELFRKDLDKEWVFDRIGDAEKMKNNRNGTNSIECYFPRIRGKESMLVYLVFELIEKNYELQEIEFLPLHFAEEELNKNTSLLRISKKKIEDEKSKPEIEFDFIFFYNLFTRESSNSKLGSLGKPNFINEWLLGDEQLTRKGEHILEGIYNNNDIGINTDAFNVDYCSMLSSVNWYKDIPQFSDFSEIVSNDLGSEFSLQKLQTILLGYIYNDAHLEGMTIDAFLEMKLINFSVHLLGDRIEEGLKLFEKLKPVLKFVLENKLDTWMKSNEMSKKVFSFDVTAAEVNFQNVINKHFSFFGVEFRTISNFDFIANKRESINRNTSLTSSDEITFWVKRFYHLHHDEQTRLLKFYKDWILKFEIADDFKIDTSDGYYKILFKIDGKWMNLNDLGRGVTMLLPIILSLKLTHSDDEMYNQTNEQFKPQVIIIEEPDSNLHPALQSRLADFFVAASKTFNTQFIIETHSEYLIRKLQYLTAKGEIKPEDTQIYYFHPPNDVPEGEEQVYPINIKADGSLTKNFGTGFFDEAGNIALELFLLKKEQTN